MTTPSLPLLVAIPLLFAAPAHGIRYNPGSARSALDTKQAEINHEAGEIARKLKYLRDRGLVCTRYAQEVNGFFLTPTERKHARYKTEVQQELARLRSGVQSKPDTFASIDACETYKTTAIQDFTNKKTMIATARRNLKHNITRPAHADLQELYREKKVRLVNRTGFEALSLAFERTENVPECPPDAQRVFLSLAHLRNEDADLNKFVARMDQLDQLLDAYGDSLSSMIRDIGSIKCDTALAPEPPSAKPDPKPMPVPSPRPAPTAKPTETSTDPQREPVREPVREPAQPEAGEPAPITESDRWGKPRSWKDYDSYKDSIGAPNKVTGVDVNGFYKEFTRANGIQIRNPDDALRLQRAINETTLQVAGPDGLGPSVYQDGQVGSRTKSALYLMQNDPYYRDALLANLRRQGLVR